MFELWPPHCGGKIISPENIEAHVAKIKGDGKTIATLNGSFDLMHAGHLHIIYEASQAADVLFMALNSDASIKKYKDPSRPIVALEHRLQMVAALGFVDYVTWFEETDPRAFLQKVKPEVHVNGVEYGEKCIEADVVEACGGRVHVVSLVPGLSTSQLIKKILTSCA